MIAFQTPGLRARNQRFEQICQRFLDDGRVDELENLISITKDIFDVDRGMLYMYLLKAYCES
jgi:leucine-rich PPR motif-containing protein